MTTALRRLERLLQTPTDPAGLAAFRFLFGALIALGSARFLDAGWPEKLYGAPSFFFRFAGFSGVPTPDGDTARLLYGIFVVLGILIATGTVYRVSVATFVVLFAWVQLGDVTNYLNHYWLVRRRLAPLCTPRDRALRRRLRAALPGRLRLRLCRRRQAGA